MDGAAAQDMDGSDLGDGDNYEDDVEKKEYVKKEYFAKPYHADGVTEAAVNKLIIKNTRPTIQMRMTKTRKEFALENYQMIEKDAADITIDLKFQGKAGSI